MKRVIAIIPLMFVLAGCLGFGGKKPLPDVRSQVPGAQEVNNYLEQTTSAESVHCVEDGDEANTEKQTFFHDGYAKISSHHVGRDVSHQWDESWNNAIGETLEEKFPELISDDAKMHEGELAQLGCGGFSLAGKEDKKRFWALFLASLARVQSGFDPSFSEKNDSGLFALDPDKMGLLGGECAGKDKFDFMEPTYSFGCALEGIKAQMKDSGKIFSETPKSLVPFQKLTGPARFEFMKFFKAHAAPQFAFCQTGVTAPSELVTANREGEKSSSKCSPEKLRRINETLDRSDIKGNTGIAEGDLRRTDCEGGNCPAVDASGNVINGESSSSRDGSESTASGAISK